jgi:hypothetical protein
MNSAAACGHTIASYAWSVVGSSTTAVDGANTPSATVVAPSSGSITVQVTVTDDAGLTDSAQVVVGATSATTAAPASAGNGTCPASVSPVVVAVTPGSASLQTGAVQAFTAELTNTTNTAVTWQVNGVAGGNGSIGTITSAGLYTAPASVSSTLTVTVTAVSAADSSRSGSAQVTVTAVASTSSTAVVSATSGAATGGGGGGGGGGAIDLLTLLVAGGLTLAVVRQRYGGK